MIEYYSAVTVRRSYIRSSPGGASIRQIETDTTVLMDTADLYPEGAEIGYYRVTSPEAGYIVWADVTYPEPHGTTDACTAPTSVSLNTETKTLSASGGAGGYLNTFTGYQYSYRDRLAAVGSAWGNWSAAATLGASEPSSLAVTAPPGYARQFRVRAIGSAGEDYYSAWVECATVLYGNTAPSAPTITRPASGAVSVYAAPTIIVACPDDSDGDVLVLWRSLDGGDWTEVCTVDSEAGTVYDRLPTLASGGHTVKYRLEDLYGALSGECERAFTVTPAVWARTIATGDVISNESISHRADITELKAAIENQLEFYGVGASWQGYSSALGRFGKWSEIMSCFRLFINDLYEQTDRAAPVWSAMPDYPTASVINELRDALV